MLWIPPRFAHGFLVVSDSADFQYKCTDFYAPEYERSVAWNDTDLDINWGVTDVDSLLLSAKDRAGVPFEVARRELEAI